MDTPQRAILWLFCLVTATIPLLFGAVHPVVLGGYIFLMLAGFGGWLVFSFEPGELRLFSFWSIVPLVIIGWLLFQALPLPFSWVELLSPERALRMSRVNELAGTDVRYLSLSENGPAGFYRSFFLVALLIYYFALSLLFRRTSRAFRWIVYSIAGVGLIEAVYGLMQFVNPSIGMLWLGIPSRAAHGTIIYKNQYASLLNMIWPLAVAGLAVHFAGLNKRFDRQTLPVTKARKRNLFTASRVEAVLLGAATLPMVLAVLFSLSRGGILSLLLVALLLILLLPFDWMKKLLFLGLFVGMLGVYGGLLGLDTIAARFASIDQSGGHRLQLYLLSLPILFDHLVAGIGLESYTLLSPIYLTGFPATTHYDRVHNEFLELTLELGLPMALLLFTWMFLGLARTGAMVLSLATERGEDRSRQIFGVAAFCSLVGFLTHGLVDFGWRLPANLYYAVTLLALIHGTACRLPATSHDPGSEAVLLGRQP